MKVLILGGTAEARSLAARLEQDSDVDVVSSLAGRVRDPRLPVGQTRIGGFGGPEGLRAYLLDTDVECVVDATHPFAVQITHHAVQACAAANVPYLRLRRPAWEPTSGDRWIEVSSTSEAAQRVADSPWRSVMVTTGRRDLAAFAHDATRHYLIRVVQDPDGPLPSQRTVVRDRGPYARADELAIMRQHAVDVLVTKNSGGPLTVAKLEAARDLGLPVVMVTRPEEPCGITVLSGVDAVAAALPMVTHQ